MRSKNFKYLKVPDGAYSLFWVKPNLNIFTLSDSLKLEPAKYRNQDKPIWVPTWRIDFRPPSEQEKFLSEIFKQDGYYLVAYRDDHFPSQFFYEKSNVIFACFGIAYCERSFYESPVLFKESTI